MPYLAIALFVSAVLALWVAARVRHASAAGTQPFLWLCVGVAVWCAAGVGHALASTAAVKLLWAKLQYLGIATVGPCWLLFTLEYAGVKWLRARVGGIPVSRLLWVIPAATVMLAATNEWHRAIWTSVVVTGPGSATYSYGPWFWGAVSYNYALLLIGSIIIVRRAYRSPSLLRQQFAAVLAAALVPWAANIVYLLRVSPIDITPLAFAVSSLLLTWALFRSALFDLVPVARDLVIDSLSDAMIVTDGARRILDMNAAARALARRKGTVTGGEPWVGRELGTIFPVLAGEPLRTTDLLLMSDALEADDAPVWFEVRMLPVQWRGRPSGAWVVMLRDVTEQRRAAAEREALERRVEEQDRRESLSILAAGVAHEFNNLLAGIVGNADLLAMQVPASSAMGGNVGEILISAQRAAALVSKMLAYAGEGHAAITRVDLDVVVRDAVDMARLTAGERCEIVYHGAPAAIDADAAHIGQVATNLIANAVDAVGHGGHVVVTTGVARLAADDIARMRFGRDVAPGEYAFIDVRDDGCGMDAATMRRLFKPFFTTKPIGHGLGLAAVQGIVLGHRGALEVESRRGAGSRFRAWFPRARAADGTATSGIMSFDRSIRGESSHTQPAPPTGTLRESA